MNRRIFLKKSSLLVPGLALAGTLGANPKKLFADTDIPNSFSLSIVSDQSEKTLEMMQDLLGKIQSGKNIRYTEYTLHGSHVADIAYTRHGHLVDYRNENGIVPDGLRKIALQMGFPRDCNNPVLAHFSCEEGLQKPTGIKIFKGDELLIERSFPAKDEVINLDGLKGKVSVGVDKDRTVRFIETSCRHKTCIKSGKISQAGQNLVCIPNQITVTIAGTNISGVDSITF